MLLQQKGIDGTVRCSCRCGVCGRPLKDPKSVGRGIGPVCAGKGTMTVEDNDTCHDFIPDSIEDGLILSRGENGTPCCNVPQVVVDHSPNGFEFGYGGSGPSDLALNCVELILKKLNFKGPRVKKFAGDCFRKADELHQDFKWTFISSVDESGGTVSWDAIKYWVMSRL